MLTTECSERSAKRIFSPVEPSAYLTDGHHLWRVLRGFARAEPPEESCALLEDCRTLQANVFTADELWEMQLELVSPRPRVQ
jgi:hypothetical protein